MANGRARAGAQHWRESDVRRMSGVKGNNLSSGGYAGRIAAGGNKSHLSGGDAPGGNTRTHPEHDG